MIHVYKQGGDWESKGRSYTVKAVSQNRLYTYLDSGWYRELEDCFAIDMPEQGSDHEVELRAKIKELGGKPAGRSSISTLEKQLKGLQNGNKG